MYVTICGKFVPNEGGVAGYVTEFDANITQSEACRSGK